MLNCSIVVVKPNTEKHITLKTHGAGGGNRVAQYKHKNNAREVSECTVQGLKSLGTNLSQKQIVSQ